MKQIICREMGGPETCSAIVTGNNPEEIVNNGMDHVRQAHPDLARNIQGMSREETDKWMSEFKSKFDGLPEI